MLVQNYLKILKYKNLFFIHKFNFVFFLFQRDREEPDTKSAMLVTAESELLNDDERYNTVAQVDLFLGSIKKKF